MSCNWINHYVLFLQPQVLPNILPQHSSIPRDLPDQSLVQVPTALGVLVNRQLIRRRSPDVESELG